MLSLKLHLLQPEKVGHVCYAIAQKYILCYYALGIMIYKVLKNLRMGKAS